MKIIKRIAAIILSVMMVLGMCSVVGAEGTTTSGTGTLGSIKINNAAPRETYKIYRILDLESYSGSGKTGNYAYKLRNDKVTGSTNSWSDFINSSGINGVYVTLDGDYVTWKGTADAAQFAKLALEYAKKTSTKIVADKTAPAPAATTEETTSTVTFDNLPLGYYLVETSVGTVLALDTTKPNWEINDKNVAPTVKKEVSKTAGGTYEEKSTASIGDTVYFKTTITAKKGARNYVLHDKMSDGLTFDSTASLKVQLKKQGSTTANDVTSSKYEIKKTGLESTDPCTFHVEFTQDFCDTLANDDQIIITYSATLNKNAVVAGVGNTNKTWLNYGDSSKTSEDTTTTYTYEIPVFKYTKGASGIGAETGLKDAQFILKKQGEASGMELEKVTPTPNGKEGSVYRYKKSTSETVVKTDNTGKFTIQGLAPGIYELVEKEAPKGYNKLSAPVEITIGNDGKVSYNTETDAKWVKVENKTGSLLPSTGGMGTTLFYIFGVILVIGSGVVLITKKRMK